MLFVVTLGFTTPFLAAVCLAPLLLLRTPESIEKGVDRFAWLTRRLQKPEAEFRGFRGILSTVALAIVIPVASLVVKFWTAGQFAFRLSSIRAIPGNFWTQLTVVDSLAPPELVPGIQDRFMATPEDTVAIQQDFSTIGQIFNGVEGFQGWRQISLALALLPIFLALVAFYAVFFVFAWAYRFSLKSTWLVYWPFLYVQRHETDDEIDNAVRAQAPAFAFALPVMTAALLVSAHQLLLVLPKSKLQAIESATLAENKTIKALVDAFPLGEAPLTLWIAGWAMLGW
jgi:hypothetical protein